VLKTGVSNQKCKPQRERNPQGGWRAREGFGKNVELVPTRALCTTNPVKELAKEKEQGEDESNRKTYLLGESYALFSVAVGKRLCAEITMGLFAKGLGERRGGGFQWVSLKPSLLEAGKAL